MKEFYSQNLTDTDAVAAEIASLLKPGDVLALYGEMGAGKTAFVRGLVKALCPECLPLVHSPTFAIVNEYEGDTLTVYHYDLYRIADEDDLYSTGYFDRLGGKGIVVTEWSELIDGAIPADAYRLKIEKAGETERKFVLC
ncbi:MAG: tRNA (adenosine(37)-N6)-threonylcarbamoyltransferase complex ATPase subunit type 1 TsaE [Clostridia bacterium]|nr:tRNA (adenosine(37)-N6)-threonylcarbamoyltransferase complex ATPase subunit type 1 TsaE [Clostridia bacterium]MBR6553090.1 tRNA (adenosine(37)-N6)-threonylcarbamoyltransferase complex ATPase subunit type 1 TsaE [Clostridia bacterium]